ncbi:hypothetical protein C8Q74DRAFT_1218773 [Fomes fomentarius]|nr:hypothetical protein C8Q74DRAFT_1218773 [Fomes fomentarius]
MNPPAYLYTVDEYGELPYELTHRPLPFSAPYPFASASFYPRFFVPAGPSPMRMDTTGLEYKFTAASFIDLDRQVVDSEKQREGYFDGSGEYGKFGGPQWVAGTTASTVEPQAYPKLTAAPRKPPRTQAYASKIKVQQEWLVQGFAKVKTALNRLAPSRLPRPTWTLRA